MQIKANFTSINEAQICLVNCFDFIYAIHSYLHATLLDSLLALIYFSCFQFLFQLVQMIIFL